jgi:drug/metabolite transporter (DMT)-like permease
VQEHRKGILLVAMAALLWSSGGIGIKGIADPALKVTFYRSLFAAVTLILLFGPRVLWHRQWKSTPVFLFAIASYAGCLVSFVTATKWTTAANAIFLQYAGVIWVLLLSPVVLKEPLRRRDVIAIGAAIVGMALFFVGRFEARGMAGNAMALLSSVFFASLVLALRKEREAAQSAITWGNILLAIVLLPFVGGNLSLTPRSGLVLALLGIFQIGVAYILFVRGLQQVTATEASLTGMLEPVANPIWVLVFLGELPSVYAIIGGAIVLGAIAWHTAAGKADADLPAPD